MRDEVRDKITQTTYTEALVLSDVRDGSISKIVNPNQETSSVANRILRKLCSKQSGSLLGAKQEFARSKVGAVQLIRPLMKEQLKSFYYSLLSHGMKKSKLKIFASKHHYIKNIPYLCSEI